jgi:hypothetical protein
MFMCVLKSRQAFSRNPILISEWRVVTRRSEEKVGGWREVPGPLYEWCRRFTPGREETRVLRVVFFLGSGEIERERYGIDPRMFFCWSWPRRGGPLKEGRCFVVG